eukprot:675703-Prymnesium_polylepis.1
MRRRGGGAHISPGVGKEPSLPASYLRAPLPPPPPPPPGRLSPPLPPLAAEPPNVYGGSALHSHSLKNLGILLAACDRPHLVPSHSG